MCVEKAVNCPKLEELVRFSVSPFQSLALAPAELSTEIPSDSVFRERGKREIRKIIKLVLGATQE